MESGTRIGVYEILSKLGEGGMGEVYRARDTSLNREVAVKVLPETLTGDADRLARFQREAEALAALNHPNIAHVHGLEKSGSTPAIVMELIEGPTLADRLKAGPVPLEEALPIARQIAQALEAAHERGIVHRDLKPANIKVRADGTVKVLDFGLAKAIQDDDRSAAVSQSLATKTSPALTAMGVILGTAAYMSPEQARGRSVDRRADIWAFGCVLYEMLTGQAAFKGDSLTDVLAAVVKEPPDWSLLPRATPAALRRLLRRCLEKDPNTRLRDAADARLELDDAASAPAEQPSGAAQPSPSRRRVTLGWLAAVVATGVVAAGAAWILKPVPARPLTKFSVHAAEGGRIVDASIAPDGSAVAYIADDRLWVQRFDATDPRPFDGVSEVHTIFWSPDSAMIGFQSQGQIWKVAASGGVPTPICRVSREFSAAGGAVWLDDDRIVFTTGGTGLLEVSARGGEPRSLLEPDPATEVDFHQVSALPDGRGFLFVPHRLTDSAGIELFDGVTRRRIYESDQAVRSPLYSPTGHVLFNRDNALWALPFDLKAGVTGGEPFLVATNAARPTLSQEGTLAIAINQTDRRSGELTWVGRDGTPLEVVGRAGLSFRSTRLSPDGQSAIGTVAADSGSGSDLWIVDLERSTDRRLTYEPGDNESPNWSPDGRVVVYACGRAVCARPADGTGAPVVLVPEPASNPTLSPDGRFLTFGREQTVTSVDIFLVPMVPESILVPPTEPPKSIVSAERIQENLAASPRGGYAAYTSNETGIFKVYLTQFPSGEGKWEVGEGQLPHWNGDGTRLYFIAGDRLMEVGVTMAPTVSISAPRPLFSGPQMGAVLSGAFGATPASDGSRFLVYRSSSPTESTAVNIAQNWFAEFADAARSR